MGDCWATEWLSGPFWLISSWSGSPNGVARGGARWERLGTRRAAVQSAEAQAGYGTVRSFSRSLFLSGSMEDAPTRRELADQGNGSLPARFCEAS